MPYITDTLALADQFLDKRVKLLDCQKEQVKRLHGAGLVSINGLARMFKVNKRLIQFILFPDRQKKNLADRKARGGSAQYYVTEEHNVAMKKHRTYKYQILKPIANEERKKGNT